MVLPVCANFKHTRAIIVFMNAYFDLNLYIYRSFTFIDHAIDAEDGLEGLAGGGPRIGEASPFGRWSLAPAFLD